MPNRLRIYTLESNVQISICPSWHFNTEHGYVHPQAQGRAPALGGFLSLKIQAF